MKHKIILDKENKVLILEVSIPKKRLHRDPNVRVYAEDAWKMVKDIKIDGFEVLPREACHKSCQLDNYSLFRHTGEFVFPIKQLVAPTPKQKPAIKTVKNTRTTKRNTKSKAKDAEE